jgi:general secretion pathway protein M
MRPLSSRESRLVAVLILVVLVALVLLVIVGPIVSGFEERAQRRDQLADQFLANERRIATLGNLQMRAETEQGQMRDLFISAPDPDEAGETLREQIEAAAQAAGATIKATEAIPGTEEGWARAALEAQVSHAQLAALLTRLNQIKPGVVVDTLTVTAEDALTNLKSDTINVRLEASAPFIRTP